MGSFLSRKGSKSRGLADRANYSSLANEINDISRPPRVPSIATPYQPPVYSTPVPGMQDPMWDCNTGGNRNSRGHSTSGNIKVVMCTPERAGPSFLNTGNNLNEDEGVQSSGDINFEFKPPGV